MAWGEAEARALGEQLRMARRARGWSQEHVAHRAGVAKNQLQLIETGRPSPGSATPYANPRMRTVFALCEALDLDVAVALGCTRE